MRDWRSESHKSERRCGVVALSTVQVQSFISSCRYFRLFEGLTNGEVR